VRLIAYFLSAPGHLEKIQSNFAATSKSGVDWSNTVKNYVKIKAYPRAPNHPDVNVIWNGEVPELAGGGFACSIHPGFRERQDPASVCGPSASASPTLNTASIQSAQSMASVLSIASIASISSASVASLQSLASIASIASVLSASVASLESIASLASISSASVASSESLASAASASSTIFSTTQ
jgi:hypothetical protein